MILRSKIWLIRRKLFICFENMILLITFPSLTPSPPSSKHPPTHTSPGFNPPPYRSGGGGGFINPRSRLQRTVLEEQHEVQSRGIQSLCKPRHSLTSRQHCFKKLNRPPKTSKYIYYVIWTFTSFTCWGRFFPHHMLSVSFSPGRNRACRHCWISSFWTPSGTRPL